MEENRRRDKHSPEFELMDTGVFSDNRYFDVSVEYAKSAPEDILVRITVTNHGPERAEIASASHRVVPEYVVMGKRERAAPRLARAERRD